jgi:hypothetical protein
VIPASTVRRERASSSSHLDDGAVFLLLVVESLYALAR